MTTVRDCGGGGRRYSPLGARGSTKVTLSAAAVAQQELPMARRRTRLALRWGATLHLGAKSLFVSGATTMTGEITAEDE